MSFSANLQSVNMKNTINTAISQVFPSYLWICSFQHKLTNHSFSTRDLTRFFGICDLENPILTFPPHIILSFFRAYYILPSRDGFELEFSGSSEPELWRFRAEPSRAEPSWSTSVSELKPSWIYTSLSSNFFQFPNFASVSWFQSILWSFM